MFERGCLFTQKCNLMDRSIIRSAHSTCLKRQELTLKDSWEMQSRRAGKRMLFETPFKGPHKFDLAEDRTTLFMHNPEDSSRVIHSNNVSAPEVDTVLTAMSFTGYSIVSPIAGGVSPMAGGVSPMAGGVSPMAGGVSPTDHGMSTDYGMSTDSDALHIDESESSTGHEMSSTDHEMSPIDHEMSSTDHEMSLTDPCTSRTDPCTSRTDPCTSRTDPCTSRADPCTSRTDPCTSRTDPCTSRTDPGTSSLNDKMPPTGGDKSPTRREMPPTGSEMPPTGGDKSPAGGDKSPTGSDMSSTDSDIVFMDGQMPLPIRSTVPPQYRAMVPPQYLGTVPRQYPGAVPRQYRGAVPPQYRGTVPPQYRGAVPPQYLGTVPPQYRGTVPPQYRGAVPPQYLVTVPPQYLVTVPPQYRGMVLPTDYKMPLAGHDVPPADQEMPLAGNDVPPADQEMPLAGHDVPPADQEMPLVGGDEQGVMSSMGETVLSGVGEGIENTSAGNVDNVDLPPNEGENFFREIVKHVKFKAIAAEYIGHFNLECVLYEHIETRAKVMIVHSNGSDKENTMVIGFRTPSCDSSGVAHIVEHSVLSGSAKYPVKDPFATMLKGSLHSYLNAFTFNDSTLYVMASLNNVEFFNMARVYMDAVFNPLCVHSTAQFRTEGWHIDIVKKRPQTSRAPSSSSGLTQTTSAPPFFSPQTSSSPCVLAQTSTAPSNLYTSSKASILYNILQSNLESSNTEEDDEKFLCNGVVYNEMKGYFSNHLFLANSKMQKLLFPSTYPFDSGGDPEEIRLLSHEKFAAYHTSYYIPSNCVIGFFGNGDVLERLQFVHETLKDLKDRPPVFDAHAKPQMAFNAPRKYTEVYPSNLEDSKSLAMVGWVLNPLTESMLHPDSHHHADIDATETVGLVVLDQILAGNQNSLLSKALLDSDLGTSIIGYRLNIMDKHYSYVIGLDGVSSDESQISLIETIILSVFQKYSKEQFPTEAIESAINYVEFNLKSSMEPGTNAGVDSLITLIKMYFEGKAPFHFLTYMDALQSLKATLLTSKTYFQNLIKKYFLLNQHRVLLLMKPSTEEYERIIQNEKAFLNIIQMNLSDKDKEDIYNENLKLQELQSKPDPPELQSLIPHLSVKDIEPMQERLVPCLVREYKGVKILFNERPSNGVAHMDIAFDSSPLWLDEMSLFVLFANMIIKSRFKELDEYQVANLINKQTGGVTYYIMNENVKFINKYRDITVPTGEEAKCNLVFSIKALHEKTQPMLDIFADLLLNSVLDNKNKALQYLKDSVESFKSDITKKGFIFAAKRVLSTFSSSGYINEAITGITANNFEKNLLQNFDERFCGVKMVLESMRNRLICRSNMIINLTGDAPSLASFTKDKLLEKFIDKFPENNVFNDSKPKWNTGIIDNKLIGFTLKEIHPISNYVNDLALGGRLLEPGEKFSGKDFVVSESISGGYLYNKVRILGGAYGASFSLQIDGMCYFTSHHDPNIEKTISIFRQTGKALIDSIHLLTQDDISRAIINAIRKIDAPRNVHTTGLKILQHYLFGLSQEYKQQFRNEILSTTVEDFKKFGEKLSDFLKDDSKFSISIITSKTTANAVKERKERITVIKRTTDGTYFASNHTASSYNIINY